LGIICHLPIRIEYVQYGGESLLQLDWTGPGQHPANAFKCEMDIIEDKL